MPTHTVLDAKTETGKTCKHKHGKTCKHKHGKTCKHKHIDAKTETDPFFSFFHT